MYPSDPSILDNPDDFHPDSRDRLYNWLDSAVIRPYLKLSQRMA